MYHALRWWASEIWHSREEKKFFFSIELVLFSIKLGNLIEYLYTQIIKSASTDVGRVHSRTKFAISLDPSFVP